MRIYQLTWQGEFRLTTRTEVRARRGRGFSVGLFVLALLFVAIFLAALGGVELSEGNSSDLAGPVLPLLAAGLVLLAIWSLLGAHDVSLTGKTIRVRRRGLFGSTVHEIAGAAFRGVRQETLRYQKIACRWSPHFGIYPTIDDITVQRILLVHPEHAWTVLLRQDLGEQIPQREWESYAKRFDLPLLIHDGGRLVERTPEDLDKTLRQLAAEDLLAGPTTAGPLPWSLLLASGEDQIAITVRRPAVGWRWFTAATAVPLFLLFGAIAGGPAANWPLAGPLVAAMVAAVAYLALVRPQIIITREGIEDSLRLPFLPPRPRGAMALAHIEQISVRKISGDRHRSLLLAGEGDSLVLGRGLPAGHLEWLRDYLTAAIVTA